MTKILVTGSNGQLGSELRELAGSFPSRSFLFTDVAELDITDAAAVNEFFSREKPGVVINCAAFTAVDKAEDEEPAARRINSEAAGLLASACASSGALMIHISTDYIFNGTSTHPITEEDEPHPASVYGQTKLDGEKAVRLIAPKAVILRTSWLYSSYGHNFVKTILRYGRERGTLDVVNDQTGTPTYAHDLARTILGLLPQWKGITGVETFNYSNEGVTTWFGFAQEILAIKGVQCSVKPILTKDYPTRAARPAYSVLSKDKIRKRFGIFIPDWKVSLNECLKKIE